MAGGELKALRDRLRAASGSDRELDWILANDLGGVGAVDDPIALTGSLDAAYAMVTRLQPDAYFEFGRTALHPGMIPGSNPHRFYAMIGDWGRPKIAHHDHLPLAILSALLEAMIGKET